MWLGMKRGFVMAFNNLRKLAVFAISAAMIVSLGACGTSEKSDSTASGDSESSSNTTGYDVSGVTKDDDIAAMLPESVTKDGKLTVGMDTSYAPAEFLAEDGKTPIGFDVDIAKALANMFGLEAVPQTSNFDSIIPSIGTKYDIGISSFTITSERMEAVDFVSMFKAGSTWVVKKGNPNKVDTSDLCGLKIAVQTGTTQEEEVNAAAKQCKADGKSEVQILSNKLQTDVTTNVATGKADVFYADSPVAGYAIAQTEDTLEALGEDVGVTKEAVAIKKGDSDTAKAVQAALQKLMDDGTYMKILKHWGVEAGAIDKAEINPTDLG
jgi:polar amino acid transport system substrate-binding protein